MNKATHGHMPIITTSTGKSDFENLSEAIINSGAKYIKCLKSFNNDCVSCNKVEQEMVSIGAFIMCQDCFAKEFGVTKIEIDTPLHLNYKKWLAIHQNRDI